DPEALNRLVVELHAAQLERDRLLTEHQSSMQLAEQASARVTDLERALAEATAAHENALAEARASWESERQALQTQLEQERHSQAGGPQVSESDIQIRIEAAVRVAQAQIAAERDEWRQRLEGAELQIVWERDMFKEQGEQLRKQVAALKTERDGL